MSSFRAGWIASTPASAASRGAGTWWGQKLRPPDCDKYNGHTMRMTGWVKTENVSGHLQPTIRPWDNKRNYGKDSMSRDNSLRGTRDWTKFSVTCAVQDNTQHIDTAFIFWGSGQIWIDMDSLKFEIIKQGEVAVGPICRTRCEPCDLLISLVY